MDAETKQVSDSTKCAVCWKGPELCLCNDIEPSKTKTKLLILQHPQEARNPWGTARLTSLALTNAVHKVGLSWRSLSQALGEQADPSRWAVLYLGALKESKGRSNAPFQVISHTGRQVPIKELQGIILLDGNWKQSKTLWWRNPWLTRLHRIVLNPGVPSAFNRIAKQPRKDCLCTLESARHSLAALEGENATTARLDEILKKHVEKVELNRPPAPSKPRGAFRRRHRPSERPRPAAS
jgi:DTW domain-containing protein